MVRRVQLADVADGMTGHWIRWAPWERPWILGDLAERAMTSGTTSVTLTLIGRETAPGGRAEQLLVADLRRHLALRRIPFSWAQEASIEIWASPLPSRRIETRARITIADDLGRAHSSTRTAIVDAPRAPLLSRLASRLRSRP